MSQAEQIMKMEIKVDDNGTKQIKYGDTQTFQVEIQTGQKIEGKCPLQAVLVQQKGEITVGEITVEMPEPKTYKFSFDIVFKQQYENMFEALEEEALYFDLKIGKYIHRVIYLIIKEDQNKEYYIREEEYCDYCDEPIFLEEIEEFGEEEFEEFEEMEEFGEEEITEAELLQLQENRKKNSELKQMPFTEAMSKRISITLVRMGQDFQSE